MARHSTEAIVRDHRDAFLVVADESACDGAEIISLETVAGVDREFQHGRSMSPHLLKKTQTLGDEVVEVDEFGFGEPVNIDAHGGTRSFLSGPG